MQRHRSRGIAGKAIWAVIGLGVIAYLGVAFAMAWGGTVSERHPFEAHPSDFGLVYEDVSFPSREGGLRLEGWYAPGDPGAPHLVLVHGIDSQRTANGAVDLASRLVALGYNVLLFDLRGHGTSDGGRVTGGYLERGDALGAYDYVLGRGGRAGRVGFIGFSMGAGIAVMAAAQEPGVAAVVADSPFADAADLIAQETARRTPIPEGVVPVFQPAASLFARLVFGIDFRDLRPEHAVATLHAPVFVIHGEADRRIGVDHGRRVHGNAPAGSLLWTLPGTGHVQAFVTQPDEYVERVHDYLQGRFGP